MAPRAADPATTGAAPGPLRVALADDSFLMREAISRSSQHEGGVEVVAACEDGEALMAAVERERPTWWSPTCGCRRPATTRASASPSGCARRHPEIGVVVLSQYAEPRYGLELISAGAAGRAYLLKDRVHDRGELHAAIEVVAAAAR